MFAVEGLRAGYGDLNVLTGINITVERNESIAILGANGAGKSTLVQAICGLIPTRDGRIVKEGEEIQGLAPYRRIHHGIAVVPENRHLFGELSVQTNLDLADQCARQARGDDQAERFSMDDVIDLFPAMRERLKAPAELLSGGEQQMVAIARALLLQPDLLIMDEPSTGLAPKVVKDIVRIIVHLRSQGMSVVLVEQNVAIAAEISDRAYLLSLGHVVDVVTPREGESLLDSTDVLRAYLGG